MVLKSYQSLDLMPLYRGRDMKKQAADTIRKKKKYGMMAKIIMKARY